MVWFQCEDCGENLKKPKLPNHFRMCSAGKLSCIDCGERFSQETVQGHTQCITEAEKYGPKGEGKPSHGTQLKPEKPKKNADVDIHVGLSSRPPWFCSIKIGSGTNIQDNSLIHVAKHSLSGKILPTTIGDNVTVGHSAVLHGCTVEDEAFVGMGAILLDGAVVEKHAMVAAGALLTENSRVPAGEVWAGSPAKFLRKLKDEEVTFIAQSAANYSNLAQVHATENAKTFDEIELEKLLRKKFERQDEEYDSMLGVVREVPPQLILPNNIMPEKSLKASQ